MSDSTRPSKKLFSTFFCLKVSESIFPFRFQSSETKNGEITMANVNVNELMEYYEYDVVEEVLNFSVWESNGLVSARKYKSLTLVQFDCMGADCTITTIDGRTKVISADRTENAMKMQATRFLKENLTETMLKEKGFNWEMSDSAISTKGMIDRAFETNEDYENYEGSAYVFAIQQDIERRKAEKLEKAQQELLAYLNGNSHIFREINVFDDCVHFRVMCSKDYHKQVVQALTRYTRYKNKIQSNKMGGVLGRFTYCFKINLKTLPTR